MHLERPWVFCNGFRGFPEFIETEILTASQAAIFYIVVLFICLHKFLFVSSFTFIF
jgi:hypothetical protein